MNNSGFSRFALVSDKFLDDPNYGLSLVFLIVNRPAGDRLDTNCFTIGMRGGVDKSGF